MVSTDEIGSLPVRSYKPLAHDSKLDELAEFYSKGTTEELRRDLLSLVDLRIASSKIGIEQVQHLLVSLAEAMIQQNRARQSESARFIEWLESILRIPGDEGLNALVGKSHINDYIGDYQKDEDSLTFDELMGILHRNRTRLGVSLSDARLVARLREEYEKSLAALLPIKARLSSTDKLIDQIVYRLYGLTEEEIAVVEGRG